MKTGLLDNLKSIVALSLEKRELCSQLNELEKQVFVKTDESSQLQEDIEKNEKEILSKKKQLHFLELQAGELNDAEKEFRSKIDSVQNQKELDCITHELQMVQEKRNQIEDELIQEWNSFEREKNDFERYRQEQNEKIAANEAMVEKLKNQMNELRLKINPMQKKIEAESKALPELIRNVYMRIESKKIQNPIAPFCNGMCGGCYHTLPPQFASDIEKNEVATCLNCYRILYLQQEEKAPEQEAEKTPKENAPEPTENNDVDKPL